MKRVSRFVVLALLVGGCASEEIQTDVNCFRGLAAGFPCWGIDLAAHIPRGALDGSRRLNDIWGWADPQSDREFALVGTDRGVAFVEVTRPTEPVVVGTLPAHGVPFGAFAQSKWRDIKVLNDHAFVVSEAADHGMQVFDLRQLLSAAPETVFEETAHYAPEVPDDDVEEHEDTPGVSSLHFESASPARGNLGSAHNVVAVEGADTVVIVGSNDCQGGLHLVDVADPTAPTRAGCYGGAGYTHDAHCVLYAGPDTDHAGRTLCFGANGQVHDDDHGHEHGQSSIVIVDISDPAAPALIADVTYPGSWYAHQGWLDEDHRYFYFGDELDEVRYGVRTTTFVLDVADLDAPVLVGAVEHRSPASDHNLYVSGGRLYEANYAAGLRVLALNDPAVLDLEEVAYFDTYPLDNDAGFRGAWSVYPFLPSGTLLVSSIGEGLFALTPQ